MNVGCVETCSVMRVIEICRSVWVLQRSGSVVELRRLAMEKCERSRLQHGTQHGTQDNRVKVIAETIVGQ